MQNRVRRSGDTSVFRCAMPRWTAIAQRIHNVREPDQRTIPRGLYDTAKMLCDMGITGVRRWQFRGYTDILSLEVQDPFGSRVRSRAGEPGSV
jgi:hypothetical protein